MTRRFMVTVVALTMSLLVVSAMTVVILVQIQVQPLPATPLCDTNVFGPDCVGESRASPQWVSTPRAIDRVTKDQSTSPVRVVIPSLGVDAPVVPVGKTKGNSLEIPDDIDEIGWYRYGAAPAWGFGSTVLVGHRDGVVEGHGAFYNLAALSPGDIVEVSDTLQRESRFRVIARAVISKQEFANRSPELFAQDGPARLRLISCGGYYDSEHGGYQSNVVVTAKPES